MTPTHNELIVPNSKLAGSILENYSSPSEMSGLIYTIGVDFREDIDSVEKVISDALHETAKTDAHIDASSIWVRFDSFGEYSLDFKFGYSIRGYVNRFSVLKEVNRELFYSFRTKGIRVPFPVRVVHNVPPQKEEEKKRR